MSRVSFAIIDAVAIDIERGRKEFNIAGNGDWGCSSLLEFNENINEKIWNWMEITYDDIKESVEQNNLVKYEKINFDNAVWCCFQKN